MLKHCEKLKYLILFYLFLFISLFSHISNGNKISKSTSQGKATNQRCIKSHMSCLLRYSVIGTELIRVIE